MSEILKLIPLMGHQRAAIQSPYVHTCFFGGIATGKSMVGAHFVIKQVLEKPNLSGLIGANTFDQLSSATLRELFYWLEQYGFEYVIDCMPPLNWGVKRKLKTHKNVLSIRNPWTGTVTTVFTRVLSDPNALRGLTLSWYYCDELRDTPRETHDVILARLRESDYIAGLVTTTTNGFDWVYDRWVKNRPEGNLYGSLHVETYESVLHGIITQSFYDSLRASYSPLFAQQELEAKHVNVKGGRAYYAVSNGNELRTAPWGDAHPNLERPLIVGCDFNFAPAPCIWVYGQAGPDEWEDHLHWFGELAMTSVSTETMTQSLIMKCPGFYYRVFGDSSGNRGTTSNAGETDYMRMAGVFEDYGAGFFIDSDQANPLVKDRVEAVNAMSLNALGQRRMTYNPDACPYLHDDFQGVGWDERGKLRGQNVNQTHASDGAGYAIFKLFGPQSFAEVNPEQDNIASPYR